MKILFGQIAKSVASNAASTRNIVARVVVSKKFKVGAIGIIVAAVFGGGAYGAFELRANSYYQGCVDGGAIGLISLMPFAARPVITQRREIFKSICSDLKKKTSEGKSLDDLVKATGEKSRQEDQGQPQEGNEEPSN